MLHEQNGDNGKINGHVSMEEKKYYREPSLDKELQAIMATDRGLIILPHE